jgi:hypothetical protein
MLSTPLKGLLSDAVGGCLTEHLSRGHGTICEDFFQPFSAIFNSE